MSQKTLRVACPCCGANLQVDVESSQVLFAEEAKRSQQFSFDAQLEQIQKQKDQADQLFEKVFLDESERRKTLERKFEEAQKRALEDKSNVKPRNPFDMD
jgi:hypothetical protein